MILHCHMTTATGMNRRKVLPAELTSNTWRLPLNSMFNVYISPTLCISYQCIWRWQHLKKTLPKCHFTHLFCYFYFALWLHPWLCWLLERSQISSCPTTHCYCLLMLAASELKNFLRKLSDNRLSLFYIRSQFDIFFWKYVFKICCL